MASGMLLKERFFIFILFFTSGPFLLIYNFAAGLILTLNSVMCFSLCKAVYMLDVLPSRLTCHKSVPLEFCRLLQGVLQPEMPEISQRHNQIVGASEN